MNLSNCEKQYPIALECCDKIKSFAFDGCSYFFTLNCQPVIIKTSLCFDQEKCYETCRIYKSICYDYKEHCFWATSKQYSNIIFKLNCCFKEIDYIKIDKYCSNLGLITGISYNCCFDKLIVSFTGAVIELDKHNGNFNKMFCNDDTMITGVFSLCPGLIVTLIKDCKYYIYILDDDSKIIKCCELPNNLSIEGIVFNPCEKSHKPSIDFLVMIKDCYAYLYQQSLCCCDLGFEPCCCNYKICEECCEHCIKPDHKNNSCDDLMESIALMETALSHILNAEGEKLQKVLHETKDINTILCVNEQINKTIINATHLEHVLYAKLSNIDCNCCKKDRICDCDVDGETF